SRSVGPVSRSSRKPTNNKAMRNRPIMAAAMMMKVRLGPVRSVSSSSNIRSSSSPKSNSSSPPKSNSSLSNVNSSPASPVSSSSKLKSSSSKPKSSSGGLLLMKSSFSCGCCAAQLFAQNFQIRQWYHDRFASYQHHLRARHS